MGARDGFVMHAVTDEAACEVVQGGTGVPLGAGGTAAQLPSACELAKRFHSLS